MERQMAFNGLPDTLLSTINNNNNVQQIVHNISNTLDKYQIPNPITAFPCQPQIDLTALEFLPSDAPQDMLPIHCTGNGNCLFNAISILLCGNESMCTELRIRAAVALIQLQENFTHPSGRPVRQLIHEQSVLYAPFGATDYTVSPTTMIDHQINTIFQNELITTLTNNAWSGMWQLIALATALQMPIWSVYPDYNPRCRNIFNKIVQPLLNVQNEMFILPIMWTGYVNNTGFHPNHFVPLVPRTFIIEQQQHTIPITKITQPVPVQHSTGSNSQHTIVTTPGVNFLKFMSTYSKYCTSCKKRILLKEEKQLPNYGPVCNYCYRYLKDEKQSPIHLKYMYPGDIPKEIADLNGTELKMISQVHPYMNLLSLPSGGQHGLKGQSINIPVPIQNLCSTLPRNTDSSPYVKIYSSKSQMYFEQVNTSTINNALTWLIKYNIHYKDMVPNNKDNDCPTYNENGNKSKQDPIPNEGPNVECIALVPVDYQVTSENNSTDQAYRLPLIPGSPVNIFSSPNLEELAFPNLYPYGTHGIHFNRTTQPTVSEYFKCRLLNHDKRWISTPQYIFWSLHIFEQEKLQSAISVALRNRTQAQNRLSVEDVSTCGNINQNTDNYMFMKQIRGTAAYWKNELSKLMAKIRTLGPPTFFMSLSANDIHWTDNLNFINPSLSTEEISKLSYAEKCKLLRENPIASAIHFNNRWESFLHHHLLAKPYPLGHISDYFARIEFQARGSPHLHILLWISDAPNFESDQHETLIAFIDSYISGRVSDLPPEKANLVTSLQTHNHTFTCQRQKSKKCRFDFPMPISENTRMKIETDTGSSSRFYILKRSEKDMFINPYNENILFTWQANMDIQIVGSMYAVAKYVCTYICKNEPFEFRQAISSCLNKLAPGSSQRKIMSNVGNILLTHRTIGLQEAAYRILGLNLVYSSRETVFIDTSLSEKRYRILKRKKDLQELPAGSTDIFNDGMPQYYMHRPQDETFKEMCLAEFITTYKLTNYIPKTEKGLPRYTLNVKGQQKTIMQRSKKACLRYYIPEILLNEKGYYFSLLYLLLPFYNESEIIHPYKTYQEAFMHKQHLLDKTQLEQMNLSKKFDTAVQHLLSLSHNDLDDIHSLITPGYQNIADISNEEGAKEQGDIFKFDIMNGKEEKNEMCDFNITMFKKLAQQQMTEDEFQTKKAMLTETQQKVFELIENHNNTNPMHLFITGGAGTGKSFLLRMVREHLLRKNNGEYPNVVIAAPTGVAAYNINGHTIHTLLQLPTQDKSNASYRPLSPRSLKILQETFKYVQYLIIDEISFVSYNTLEHIHLRLNEIKGLYLDTEAYFGNINLLAFGDLYQLRPVYGGAIFSDKIATDTLHLWKDFFTVIELTENKRQCTDTQYAQLLNRIRVGEHTTEDVEILQTRLLPPQEIPIELIHIYPRKDDRDKQNEIRIHNVSQDNKIYKIHAIHDADEKYIPNDDQKCAGIPRTISLCEKARVMLIRNINTQNGLVNGAQGTVHSMEWDIGKKPEKDMPRCVNVVFDDTNIFNHITPNNNQPIGIQPLTVRFLGYDHKYISRTQIPLILSFSTTVHKVQGLTLAKAVCDLGPSVFQGGMAYVALSRVSTMKDIFLTKLCPSRIYPSQNVKTEMERLRRKTKNIKVNNATKEK